MKQVWCLQSRWVSSQVLTMKLAFFVLGMRLLVGLSPVAAFAGSYTFVTIDDPLESGVAGSAVTGINDLGHVVGEYTDSSGKEHGHFLRSHSS